MIGETLNRVAPGYSKQKRHESLRTVRRDGRAAANLRFGEHTVSWLPRPAP